MPTAVGGHLCPVCGMAAKPGISSNYKGKTYWFCMQEDKETFDATPDKFAN
jgi:YHS domain-containing protein